MDREELNAKFRQKLQAPPDPPLEATRKFLQSYCADAGSLQSVRESVRQMLALNSRTVVAGLSGIEGLLADPPAEEGALLRLVAVDAGKVLRDDSDAGAREWLESVAQMLRTELAASRS